MSEKCPTCSAATMAVGPAAYCPACGTLATPAGPVVPSVLKVFRERIRERLAAEVAGRRAAGPRVVGGGR